MALTAAPAVRYKPRASVARAVAVSQTEVAMKTYSAKPADVEKKWVLIDATGLVVGRLASIVAHAAARQAQAELHARMSTAATTSSSSTPTRWC